MQKEINKPTILLDEKGYLREPGWAKQLFWEYNREKISPENLIRIKEWDYYLLANENYAVSFSIAFVGRGSQITTTFMNFNKGVHFQKSSLSIEDINLPLNEIDPVNIKTIDSKGSCIQHGKKTKIKICMNEFYEDKNLIIDAELDSPEIEKMVIATPFNEGKELFFYNMKHNCMRVTGNMILGSDVYDFTPDKTFAVRDWGRGLWPHNTHWYWGSASGNLKGKDFGFNLGYGFGNLSAATENMIFYKGKAHKFDQIVFKIPTDSYLNQWTIESNDERFMMTFNPVLDRNTAAFEDGYGTEQHQVFGKYSGKAVLDDGSIIKVNNFFGFAEDVVFQW